MPAFTNKHKNLVIATSYKVMYSTLAENKELSEFDITSHKNIELLNNLEVYFLCRNPYHRTKSFFRDKLRVNLPTPERRITFQHCQKIILEEFNFDSDDQLKCIDFLSQMTINEFILCLPFFYSKDGHLQTQYVLYEKLQKSLSQIIKSDSNSIKCIKIENASKLLSLGDRFELDLTKKLNETQVSSSLNVLLNANSKFIINKIYSLDFEKFDYPKE